MWESSIIIELYEAYHGNEIIIIIYNELENNFNDDSGAHRRTCAVENIMIRIGYITDSDESYIADTDESYIANYDGTSDF